MATWFSTNKESRWIIFANIKEIMGVIIASKRLPPISGVRKFNVDGTSKGNFEVLDGI